MKTRRNFLAVATLAAVGVSARAAVRESGELENMERDLAGAFAKGDVERLQELLSPDWILVNSDSEMMTRAQLFSALKDGKLSFSKFAVGSLSVRVYGDAAVVIGTDSVAGTWDGELFESRDRFTDVFIRRDDRWRCVSTQSTEIPPADAPEKR